MNFENYLTTLQKALPNFEEFANSYPTFNQEKLYEYYNNGAKFTFSIPEELRHNKPSIELLINYSNITSITELPFQLHRDFRSQDSTLGINFGSSDDSTRFYISGQKVFFDNLETEFYEESTEDLFLKSLLFYIELRFQVYELKKLPKEVILEKYNWPFQLADFWLTLIQEIPGYEPPSL